MGSLLQFTPSKPEVEESLVRANQAAINKLRLQQIVAVTESDMPFSDFLLFKEHRSLSDADLAPGLSYLRVELRRIRPGMNDFLFRAATPSLDKQDPASIVTLRVHKSLANPPGCGRVANMLRDQMRELKDETHDWANADLEHLAKMLLAKIRFFAQNPDAESLQFTTEALR